MKKILVAEASSTIKSVADSLLRQNGYDVVCTSDGLQAWDVIKAEKPELVLAGIGLSGISGLELCQQMSGDPLTGGIPVVLLIGANDNVTEEQLLSSGVRGQLRKPFSPRDLLNIVSNLVGQGEESTRASTAAGDKTNATSYNSEILSSTRHAKGELKEVYNLDWTDLSDSKIKQPPAPERVTSLDLSDESQDLIIEDDEFNLVREDRNDGGAQAPSGLSSGDEDYDWFIGEMKKEIEDRPDSVDSGAGEGRHQISKSDRLVTPSDSELKFDDVGPPDPGLSPRSSGGTGIRQETRAGRQPKPEKIPWVLSETDIDRIADRIAQKLAAAVAARIDRNQIIDAIKSILKS